MSHRDLRASAAEFVRREIVPHLQGWEDAGTIPRQLHLAAARQGLLGLSFPESVGGEGGDLADSVAMQEAMFEAGASSGLMAGLFTGGIALPHLAASGSRDLVERFVRPTLAGETIGALAVTEPGGGSDVAAQHAYGIAARSLALTAAYCRDRETFGRPLVANQVVRHQLVEMHRQVEVARCYVRDTARRHVAGESVIAEACLAKQTAVDAATYVCDRAVQLHGGTGYLHGSEVERHYRDARILPIGGGATEVLTDLSARLLGYAS